MPISVTLTIHPIINLSLKKQKKEPLQRTFYCPLCNKMIYVGPAGWCTSAWCPCCSTCSARCSTTSLASMIVKPVSIEHVLNIMGWCLTCSFNLHKTLYCINKYKKHGIKHHRIAFTTCLIICTHTHSEYATYCNHFGTVRQFDISLLLKNQHCNFWAFYF